jgi:hypothetical protein
MKPTHDPAPSRTDPGVIRYALVCLGGLVAMALVLLEHGYGEWSLLPALVGILGGLTRFGPALVPIALVMLLNAPPHFALPFSRRAALSLSDLVLCGAALAYVVAHYRMQSLVHRIFPFDPRVRSKRRGAGGSSGCRPTRLADGQEVGFLLLTLPFWAFVVQLTWRQLPLNWGTTGDPWLAVPVLLTLGLALTVLSSALGYWRQRWLRPEEARLFVQDVLWQETRAEQRRVNRWLVWALLLAAKRPGKRDRQRSP